MAKLNDAVMVPTGWGDFYLKQVVLVDSVGRAYVENYDHYKKENEPGEWEVVGSYVEVVEPATWYRPQRTRVQFQRHETSDQQPV